MLSLGQVHSFVIPFKLKTKRVCQSTKILKFKALIKHSSVLWISLMSFLVNMMSSTYTKKIIVCDL